MAVSVYHPNIKNVIFGIVIVIVIIVILVYLAHRISYTLRTSSIELFTESDYTADIEQRLTPLNNYLTKFRNLNLPVSFTDEATICNPWGIYQNNKYINNENICLMVDNSGTRKCLTGSENVLVPCSKIYADGVLETANTINTSEVYNSASANMRTEYAKLDRQTADVMTELDSKIATAGKYLDIVNLQSNIINNNKVGLQDRKLLNNQNNTELENKTGKMYIERANYELILKNKEEMDQTLALFKKIIIGMIIVFGLCLLVIYLSSNIL